MLKNNLENNLSKLPFPLGLYVFDFVWGSPIIYKQKLKIVDTLPKDRFWLGNWILKSPIFCHRNGILYEVEDDLYCPKCGEKTVFPFTREICWDCEEWI